MEQSSKREASASNSRRNALGNLSNGSSSAFIPPTLTNGGRNAAPLVHTTGQTVIPASSSHADQNPTTSRPLPGGRGGSTPSAHEEDSQATKRGAGRPKGKSKKYDRLQSSNRTLRTRSRSTNNNDSTNVTSRSSTPAAGANATRQPTQGARGRNAVRDGSISPPPTYVSATTTTINPNSGAALANATSSTTSTRASVAAVERRPIQHANGDGRTQNQFRPISISPTVPPQHSTAAAAASTTTGTTQNNASILPRPTPAPSLPVPQTRRVRQPTAATSQSQKRQRRIQTVSCKGVYDGFFGPALSFVAASLMHTARTLLQWSKQPDFGVKSFKESCLLPYKGTVIERASEPTDGYVIRRSDCTQQCNDGAPRCDVCAAAKDTSSRNIKRKHNPRPPERAHPKTKIGAIAANRDLAEIEIRELRGENKRLKKENARKVFLKDLKVNGKPMSGKELKRVKKAMDIMDNEVANALEEGGAEEELELWHIHKQHIDEVWNNRKTKKNARVHPTLLNWAIAFLARTSASVYNEVRKVMKLPHISYVYKKTAEMVSTMDDKAYAINFDTVREMKARAEREKWTEHQRTGALAQDSMNISPTIEHDYVSNKLEGGDESHKLGDLTHMFQLLANQAKEANATDEEEAAAADTNQVRMSLCQLYFSSAIIQSNFRCICVSPQAPELDNGRATTCQ